MADADVAYVKHMDTGEPHLDHFRNVWLQTPPQHWQGDRCLVWHGGVLWASQDPFQRALPSGMFLSLAIPGMLKPACTTIEVKSTRSSILRTGG